MIKPIYTTLLSRLKTFGYIVHQRPYSESLETNTTTGIKFHFSYDSLESEIASDVLTGRDETIAFMLSISTLAAAFEQLDMIDLLDMVQALLIDFTYGNATIDELSVSREDSTDPEIVYTIQFSYNYWKSYE